MLVTGFYFRIASFSPFSIWALLQNSTFQSDFKLKLLYEVFNFHAKNKNRKTITFSLLIKIENKAVPEMELLRGDRLVSRQFPKFTWLSFGGQERRPLFHRMQGCPFIIIIMQIFYCSRHFKNEAPVPNNQVFAFFKGNRNS